MKKLVYIQKIQTISQLNSETLSEKTKQYKTSSSNNNKTFFDILPIRNECENESIVEGPKESEHQTTHPTNQKKYPPTDSTCGWNCEKQGFSSQPHGQK